MPETRPSTVEGVRYIVTGRVQGVGYRAWTVRRASSHGIFGTVRNLPDGSVRIDAVGDAAALETFRRELLSGPSRAHVTSVSPARIELPTTTEFTILY